MQPWYPVSSSKMSISASPAKKSDGKKDKSPVKTVPKITATGFDPDAIAELKQALEVSSYQIFSEQGQYASCMQSWPILHLSSLPCAANQRHRVELGCVRAPSCVYQSDVATYI